MPTNFPGRSFYFSVNEGIAGAPSSNIVQAGTDLTAITSILPANLGWIIRDFDVSPAANIAFCGQINIEVDNVTVSSVPVPIALHLAAPWQVWAHRLSIPDAHCLYYFQQIAPLSAAHVAARSIYRVNKNSAGWDRCAAADVQPVGLPAFQESVAYLESIAAIRNGGIDYVFYTSRGSLYRIVVDATGATTEHVQLDILPFGPNPLSWTVWDFSRLRICGNQLLAVCKMDTWQVDGLRDGAIVFNNLMGASAAVSVCRLFYDFVGIDGYRGFEIEQAILNGPYLLFLSGASIWQANVGAAPAAPGNSERVSNCNLYFGAGTVRGGYRSTLAAR